MPLTPEELDRIDRFDELRAEEDIRRLEESERSALEEMNRPSKFQRLGGGVEGALSLLSRSLKRGSAPPPQIGLSDHQREYFERRRKELGAVWYGNDHSEACRVSERIRFGLKPLSPSQGHSTTPPVYSESPEQREARKTEEAKASLDRLEAAARDQYHDEWKDVRQDTLSRQRIEKALKQQDELKSERFLPPVQE